MLQTISLFGTMEMPEMAFIYQVRKIQFSEFGEFNMEYAKALLLRRLQEAVRSQNNWAKIDTTFNCERRYAFLNIHVPQVVVLHYRLAGCLVPAIFIFLFG